MAHAWQALLGQVLPHLVLLRPGHLCVAGTWGLLICGLCSQGRQSLPCAELSWKEISGGFSCWILW